VEQLHKRIFEMPMKISKDAIAKASRANEINTLVKSVKDNLKDGKGVVILVLDKDGGQRGGQVNITKDNPQWGQIKKIVTAAVRADENAAAALLAEADVELTD
jgi:hypothetical protein